MNYLNYFSQCDRREQSYRSAKAKQLVRLIETFGLVLVLIYLYYFGKGVVCNLQLKYLQSIKTNPGFIEQFSVSSEVASMVDEANEDYNVIMELSNATEVLNTANEKLFNAINKCMVDGSQVEHFNISGKFITLDGTAKEMSSITRIERNFRKMGIFSSVQINVIDNADENEDSEITEHKFNCNLVLEGALK